MNIENLLITIDIMERAKERDSVDMRYWQHDPKVPDYKQEHLSRAMTEEAFHACGNKACLAGHIAISPEWQFAGGTVDRDGFPTMPGPIEENQFPHMPLAAWWGLDPKHAAFLIYPRHGIEIYSMPWAMVKAEHVIKTLRAIIEIGEDEYFRYIDRYWGKAIPVPSYIYEISPLIEPV